MILEDHIYTISNIVSMVELQRALEEEKDQNLEEKLKDQKFLRDLTIRFLCLAQNAQNVLTPYLC